MYSPRWHATTSAAVRGWRPRADQPPFDWLLRCRQASELPAPALSTPSSLASWNAPDAQNVFFWPLALFPAGWARLPESRSTPTGRMPTVPTPQTHEFATESVLLLLASHFSPMQRGLRIRGFLQCSAVSLLAFLCDPVVSLLLHCFDLLDDGFFFAFPPVEPAVALAGFGAKAEPFDSVQEGSLQKSAPLLAVFFGQ